MRSIEADIRRVKPWMSDRSGLPSAGSARYSVNDQMWVAEQMVWAVAFTQEIQYPLICIHRWEEH
jgi:hypothetical protein